LLVTLQIAILFKKKTEVLVFMPILLKDVTPSSKDNTSNSANKEEVMSIIRIFKFSILPDPRVTLASTLISGGWRTKIGPATKQEEIGVSQPDTSLVEVIMQNPGASRRVG